MVVLFTSSYLPPWAGIGMRAQHHQIDAHKQAYCPSGRTRQLRNEKHANSIAIGSGNTDVVAVYQNDRLARSVCTENLNSDVVVMKSAKDRV